MNAASSVTDAASPSGETDAAGWDCHVHVFDAAAPVRPGHYVPGHSPLAAIEQRARAHGIGHLVLVQPSVYGTDNAVMLQALLSARGRHRGVAVVDAGIAERELDLLHGAGVRGVRFNLVSPAGHHGDVAADLNRLAPRLRERGWHVQWYVRAHDLPRLVGWQEQTGLCFVLDHLAGLGTDIPESHPAWDATRSLAAAGAWIKLSGWYRLGAADRHAVLEPNIRQVAAIFGQRMVWGSDWPHTGLPPERLPRYESNLLAMRSAIEASRFEAVLHEQPGELYR